jgi:hypothetical protein
MPLAASPLPEWAAMAGAAAYADRRGKDLLRARVLSYARALRSPKDARPRTSATPQPSQGQYSHNRLARNEVKEGLQGKGWSRGGRHGNHGACGLCEIGA